MPSFYRHGHLFVLSSLYESQNMALLEAASCGLPAVGTAVGLLPQLLPAAQLAPTGDAHMLARCLIHLLGDEERRLGEARRLQEVVRNRYCLETRVKRLEEIYQAITSARPGWAAPHTNHGKQAK
jgi:glycosyltransferase involved in cell wall biosynthesis